jgi:hypothetical protein
MCFPFQLRIHSTFSECLSPLHGASSGCGWRRQPPNVGGGGELRIYCVSSRGQPTRIVYQLGSWAGGLTNPHLTKSYEMLHRVSDFGKCT